MSQEDKGLGNAEIQAAIAGRHEELKQDAQQTLGQIVPVLKIDIKPTNVDPGSPGGVQNMKRVLNAILNDEGNEITVKDEDGRAVGVRNFNEIYPQVVGPDSSGAIQVEYHEQATLHWIGDVLWSLKWFFRNGLLGVPRQMTTAVLQELGLKFVLETYYQQWLKSILDHFNQRGLIPGYTNPSTGKDNWVVTTEVSGRNIIVKPAGHYVFADLGT